MIDTPILAMFYEKNFENVETSLYSLGFLNLHLNLCGGHQTGFVIQVQRGLVE